MLRSRLKLRAIVADDFNRGLGQCEVQITTRSGLKNLPRALRDRLRVGCQWQINDDIQFGLD